LQSRRVDRYQPHSEYDQDRQVQEAIRRQICFVVWIERLEQTWGKELLKSGKVSGLRISLMVSNDFTRW
jgi:hypothetical protein